MKFSALMAIVPDNLEQPCVDIAKEIGAGGITVLQGRGISHQTHKTFFGLAYDGSQSILMMVLEKSLSLEVLRAMQQLLLKQDKNSQGVVFTLPLEHLGGLDLEQMAQFEHHLVDSDRL